jgi:hypothetical protein
MSSMRVMSSAMSYMSPHYVPFWHYLETAMWGIVSLVGRERARKGPAPEGGKSEFTPRAFVGAGQPGRLKCPGCGGCLSNAPKLYLWSGEWLTS